MGRLPAAPFELRLAVLLFLALLGVADAFGAWEVRNFAAFTPGAVADTVAPMEAHDGAAGPADASERPVDLATLNRPHHMIDRALLVQDTHVHVPAYALTAALLSLIVCGLAMSSRARSALVLAAFAAPFLDFAGLWGAHLDPRHGRGFGVLTVVGGFAMGAVYLLVLVAVLLQCFLQRPRPETLHD